MYFTQHNMLFFSPIEWSFLPRSECRSQRFQNASPAIHPESPGKSWTWRHELAPEENYALLLRRAWNIVSSVDRALFVGCIYKINFLVKTSSSKLCCTGILRESLRITPSMQKFPSHPQIKVVRWFCASPLC